MRRARGLPAAAPSGGPEALRTGPLGAPLLGAPPLPHRGPRSPSSSLLSQPLCSLAAQPSSGSPPPAFQRGRAQPPGSPAGLGHRPAHTPLGPSSTNKRAKPEVGPHGKGHGFEPKSRTPFLCLSRLPGTASNLSGKVSSVKRSTPFQSHLLAPVVHRAETAGVQRRLLSPRSS